MGCMLNLHQHPTLNREQRYGWCFLYCITISDLHFYVELAAMEIIIIQRHPTGVPWMLYMLRSSNKGVCPAHCKISSTPFVVFRQLQKIVSRKSHQVIRWQRTETSFAESLWPEMTYIVVLNVLFSCQNWWSERMCAVTELNIGIWRHTFAFVEMQTPCQHIILGLINALNYVVIRL